jgi:hypothetical protein
MNLSESRLEILEPAFLRPGKLGIAPSGVLNVGPALGSSRERLFCGAPDRKMPISLLDFPFGRLKIKGAIFQRF